MDAAKQSPSDSPAPSGTTKVAKLSAATVDRLSPKTMAGKGLKRKRQGSESSTQSSVSDDTPAKAKKSRKTSDSAVNAAPTTTTTAVGHVAATTSGKQSVRKSTEHSKRRSASPASAKTNSSSSCGGHNHSTISSTTGTGSVSSHNNDTIVCVNDKTLDESSDSDEPLIEVAGKVRNSKLLSKLNADTMDQTLRNQQKPSSSDNCSSQQQPNVTHIVPLTQTRTQVGSSGIATTTTNATHSLAQTSTVSVTITPLKNVAAMLHGQSSKIDDKTCTMSTRRSVRMTNSKTIVGHHMTTMDGVEVTKKTTTNQHVLRQAGTPGGTSVEASTDARRKTRSAGESQHT